MAERRAVEVYLEIGQKRVFAGAVDWPGWCRSGRDDSTAIEALLDYAPRYARVLDGSGVQFEHPRGPDDVSVVERLPGNSTTDFGAPDAAPARDGSPVDTAELARFEAILRAGWRALAGAASAAEGKELRKGPRGGGRDVEGIAGHVMRAEAAYLRRLGAKFTVRDEAPLAEELARVQVAVVEAMAMAARGEAPERGPRGGAIWPVRYAVRRIAWHVLDHAWEIEDRIM